MQNCNNVGTIRSRRMKGENLSWKNLNGRRNTSGTTRSETNIRTTRTATEMQLFVISESFSH